MVHIADDLFLFETIGVLLMSNDFFNLLAGISVSSKEVGVDAEVCEENIITDASLTAPLLHLKNNLSVKSQVKVVAHQNFVF